MTSGSHPPATPVDPAAAMHVSIVGAAGAGDAARADNSSSSSAAAPVDQVARVLRIIEDVTSASNRTSAIEQLAAGLAMRFPGAAIRVGVGGESMKRFYDRRLGWLGKESSLFRDADRVWGRISVAESGCQISDGAAVVALPEIAGDGQMVVWIEGEQVNESSLAWLIGGLHTLQVVMWQRPMGTWRRLLNKLGLGSTFLAAVALSLVLLVAVWPTHYPISCTALVQPLQQRLVATPFEATLLEAHVKPGDSVTAGQVLVVLDGRPLRLELESIESEIQQASKQNHSALATGKIAEAQQAALKVRQMSRRRDLISDRLNRLQVISPIDGVIVSGELDRYVGSPLQTGQTLVEVAPLERMAIEIEIPEHEIGYVAPDADVRIKISAIGGRSIRQPLDDLYPSAEVREDRNVFIGRIEIDNPDRRLRPGMRGKATTYGPLRPLAWSWVRGASERVIWWLGY